MTTYKAVTQTEEPQMVGDMIRSQPEEWKFLHDKRFLPLDLQTEICEQAKKDTHGPDTKKMAITNDSPVRLT